MTDLTEKNYIQDIVRHEMDNFMSRKTGVVLSGAGVLKKGTVLGKILTGAATAAAFASASGDGRNNTGNGVMGAITVSAGVKAGVYKLTIIEAAANAGAFRVDDPDGIEIGTGNVAVAFSAHGIAFTLADGATDFVAGDGFDITVAAGSGKYIQPTATAADGSGIADRILLQDIDATSADVTALMLDRDAQVSAPSLIYGASINDTTKRGIVNAGLTAKNIQLLSGA